MNTDTGILELPVKVMQRNFASRCARRSVCLKCIEKHNPSQTQRTEGNFDGLTRL